LMYLFGFAIAAVFALVQKRQVRRFLVRHRTMGMHAAQVQGLPPRTTDEGELKRALEKVFSNAVGRPVELAYVSICYDAMRFGPELDRLLNRLITIEDVRCGAYGPDLADTIGLHAPPSPGGSPSITVAQPESEDNGMQVRAWLDAAEEEFRNDVERLLGLDEHGTPTELRCCNEAFAVFQTAGVCADVLEAMGSPDTQKTFFGVSEYQSSDKPPGGGTSEHSSWSSSSSSSEDSRLPDDSRGPLMDLSRGLTAQLSSPVKIGHLWYPSVCLFCPRMEPVGVLWRNYGKTRRERVRASILAILYVIIFVAVLDGAFLYTWTVLKLRYGRVMYHDPSGLGAQMFGICIGTANWLICVFLGGIITHTVGFLRSDREEVLIFACFTIVCVLNTLVNVSAAAFVLLPPRIQDQEASVIIALLAANSEVELSRVIVNMLWPGCFTACLLWPLQGFLWPFFQAVITLWAQDADAVSARIGELMLEPLPIGLAWDYQGCITTPILALASMFLMTERSDVTLLYLALWVLFFYSLQHFTHFRCCKIAYTTTNRLDTAVLYAWGFVLGEVAASSAWWGYRAYKWHWIWVIVAFCCGCAFYWLILRAIEPLNWVDDYKAARLLNKEVVRALEKGRRAGRRITQHIPGVGANAAAGLGQHYAPVKMPAQQTTKSDAAPRSTSRPSAGSPAGSKSAAVGSPHSCRSQRLFHRPAWGSASWKPRREPRESSPPQAFRVHQGQAMSATSLEETRSHTLFDWANCNPVLVLKSHVVDLTNAGIPPQLPFTVGKSHFWEAWRRQGGPESAPPPVADSVPYEAAAIYDRLRLERLLA